MTEPTTPPPSDAPLDPNTIEALLDDMAGRAAWMLENGATNENATLARDVIDLRHRLRDRAPEGSPRAETPPTPLEAQVREAIAVLESGTRYEQAHVASILRNGLAAQPAPPAAPGDLIRRLELLGVAATEGHPQYQQNDAIRAVDAIRAALQRPATPGDALRLADYIADVLERADKASEPVVLARGTVRAIVAALRTPAAPSEERAVVLALARCAMAWPNASTRRQVERLREVWAGDEERVSSLDRLLGPPSDSEVRVIQSAAPSERDPAPAKPRLGALYTVEEQRAFQAGYEQGQDSILDRNRPAAQAMTPDGMEKLARKITNALGTPDNKDYFVYGTVLDALREALRAVPSGAMTSEPGWSGVVSTIRPTIGVYDGGSLVTVIVPKGSPMTLVEGESVILRPSTTAPETTGDGRVTPPEQRPAPAPEERERLARMVDSLALDREILAGEWRANREPVVAAALAEQGADFRAISAALRGTEGAVPVAQRIEGCAIKHAAGFYHVADPLSRAPGSWLPAALLIYAVPSEPESAKNG